MTTNNYDAIVVGSGPNGLSAAITLKRQGLSVLLIEGNESIGGGMRTSELTMPGYLHDVCSAVHPMAITSPFFNSIPLEQFGVEFIYPEIDAAHPFDGGKSATLQRSIEKTAYSLGIDASYYQKMMNSLVKKWPLIVDDILGPLHFPKHPFAMASFGSLALQPSTLFSKKFESEEAKGLWAGMAAHSIQPLSNLSTSAIGLVLMIASHIKGWPIPKGGSQNIANALGNYFKSLGGIIETNKYIASLEELPNAKAILLDVTPKQLLKISGSKLSNIYIKQLKKYRYGMGVFKIDWALSAQIPFLNESCRRAGTIHLGNTFDEIALSEKQASEGIVSDHPFVLLNQPSVFDPTRAPEGKHTAWAYCHVPNGSKIDRTIAIENQIERFAPGFKKLILARNTFDTNELENYNPNYVGGDINGGIIDIRQLYTRPALRLSPYRTSAKGLYICSSSTPPGGGVHGMCGYHSAVRCLKDLF